MVSLEKKEKNKVFDESYIEKLEVSIVEEVRRPLFTVYQNLYLLIFVGCFLLSFFCGLALASDWFVEGITYNSYMWARLTFLMMVVVVSSYLIYTPIILFATAANIESSYVMHSHKKSFRLANLKISVLMFDYKFILNPRGFNPLFGGFLMVLIMLLGVVMFALFLPETIGGGTFIDKLPSQVEEVTQAAEKAAPFIVIISLLSRKLVYKRLARLFVVKNWNDFRLSSPK